MHEQEWNETGPCADCGEAIAAESERGFAFGTRNLLCWACAIRRGGSYDAERDQWTESPDVTDLPDEAYGTAPHEKRRV